ncbi:MAG: hypothetical protein HUJ26_13380 [Planctomycetaceae bacterium]|nr:hypothetical protein [Planctomycetaceae bacterium]
MIIQLLVLLLIAGICGSIAQRLAGAKRAGCLASIALGFIGAFLGTWIAQEFELPVIFSINIGGNAFPVIWSIIGASLFSAILAFLSGNRRTPPS